MASKGKVKDKSAEFVWTPVLTGRAGERFEEARAALDDPARALGLVAPLFREHVLHRPSLQLAAQALKKLGAEEEADLFEMVLDRPDLAGSWDSVGDHFLSAFRDDLALPFCRQAHLLSRNNEPFAINYANALNSDANHEEVIKVLQPFLKESKNPSLAFNLAWSSLLSGQIDLCKKSLKKIPKNKSLAPFRDKVQRVVERYEAFPPSSPPNARDWFFIEYGSCLLDLFKDQLEQFGGRHYLYQPTMPEVRRLLSRAVQAIEAAGWEPGPIHYFDRGGEIIARSLALLGWGEAVSHPEGETPPGLTVLTDPLRLSAEQLQFLEPDNDGVRTFSLALDWGRMSPFVPDLVGVAWRTGAFPWEERLGVRIEGGERVPEELPARDDPADELAREIVAAESDDDQVDEVVEFVSARRQFFARPRPITFPYLTDMPLPRVDLEL